MVWFGAWRVNGSLSVSRAIGMKFNTVPFLFSLSCPLFVINLQGINVCTHGVSHWLQTLPRNLGS